MVANAEGGFFDYGNGCQLFRPDRTKVNRIDYNKGMKKPLKIEATVAVTDSEKPAEPKKP